MLDRYRGHNFYSIFDAILAKPRNPVRCEIISWQNRTTEAASKFNMGNTTVELTEQHNFFLREKPLELQKQTQNASIVSIMQDLIEKDWQQWSNHKIFKPRKS